MVASARTTASKSAPTSSGYSDRFGKGKKGKRTRFLRNLFFSFSWPNRTVCFAKFNYFSFFRHCGSQASQVGRVQRAQNWRPRSHPQHKPGMEIKEISFLIPLFSCTWFPLLIVCVCLFFISSPIEKISNSIIRRPRSRPSLCTQTRGEMCGFVPMRATPCLSNQQSFGCYFPPSLIMVS